IETTRGGDTLLGVVNAGDGALACSGCELAHRSATTTANIEDDVALSNRYLLQPPVGQFRVSPVHRPKDKSPHPSRWFLVLTRLFPDCVRSVGIRRSQLTLTENRALRPARSTVP